MNEDMQSALGISPASLVPPPPSGTESILSDFRSKLARRYSDAYNEAHAVVMIGKIVKRVAASLFIIIIVIGCMTSAEASNEWHTNWSYAGIGFALACLIGIPTYVLGILVAAQGQTALAALDSAVNGSRHLTDDDVARVLAKRFDSGCEAWIV